VQGYPKRDQSNSFPR